MRVIILTEQLVVTITLGDVWLSVSFFFFFFTTAGSTPQSV